VLDQNCLPVKNYPCIEPPKHPQAEYMKIDEVADAEGLLLWFIDRSIKAHCE
jgi:hypothetical protein